MNPNSIPLFPLQSVLFPGGYLQLQVFETRYLDMVERCHKAGQAFGVVSLLEGGEVRRRQPGQDGFARERFNLLGTLAHISALEKPQAGLYKLRCVGGQRFRLLSTEQASHGLWSGEAELLADDAEVAVPVDLLPAAELLQTLLHKLEQGAAALDLPLQPPYRWSDCGWLANRWCELLPLPPDERQRLMQLDNPLLRLELVADQLDRLQMRP
ncbi:LON peptidase substrate-binding domain-containing protein [Roseateles oligotrophus]|uniref:LON peptidase substrate-binding domain-containing protein n=1 Tax=Roseateles oligotrophus TaxID=1769250 RepID=A0ABT2YJG3_9BURK|nr:LON peptidase substrate-binding domain-containing protein [Roseateles oligotrophus]MCV2370096.1 LON peptidase substrate-binding domain-containing protein [Roseateles oligotrophus]